MRKVVVLTWLLVLLAFIIVLFWHYEYIYKQPTPVPENYRNVRTGTP
jgi:hypothetical protein